jgi:hypothetical protein
MSQLYMYTWCVGPAYSETYIVVIAESVDQARQYLTTTPTIQPYLPIDHPNTHAVDLTTPFIADQIRNKQPLISGPIKAGVIMGLEYGTG